MSDENSPQFVFNPPAEMMEQFHISVEVTAHETRQFFLELKPEQLIKLGGLMANTKGHASHYYQGLITMLLDQRYNICFACGENHDEEIERTFGPNEVLKKAAENLKNTPPGKEVDEYKLNMISYNMEADDEGSDHVMCRNCKMWYENLEDRMQRVPGPEGCEGCRQKEKWG
jgi:hypothetical protein